MSHYFSAALARCWNRMWLSQAACVFSAQRECECWSQDITISLTVIESVLHVIFTFIMISSVTLSAVRHFIDLQTTSSEGIYCADIESWKCYITFIWQMSTLWAHRVITKAQLAPTIAETGILTSNVAVLFNVQFVVLSSGKPVRDCVLEWTLVTHTRWLGRYYHP